MQNLQNILQSNVKISFIQRQKNSKDIPITFVYIKVIVHPLKKIIRITNLFPLFIIMFLCLVK